MSLPCHYCPTSHWARFQITGKLAKAAPGPRRDRAGRPYWWLLEVRGSGDHRFVARCAPSTGRQAKQMLGRDIEMTGELDPQPLPGDPILQVSSVEDLTPREDNAGFAGIPAHPLLEYSPHADSPKPEPDLPDAARPANQ